jgi:uncharacterized protein (TIGR02231 family)
MITFKAPITAVAVYTDRALVTRQGRTKLGQGEQELWLEELPHTLLPESVRASGRGTVEMRILSVDVAPTFHVEAPQERVAELQGELEEREDKDALLAQREEALQARREFLTKLSQASAGSLARGIALGKSEISAGAEIISFVDDNLSTTGQEMQDLRHQRREVAREVERLRKELEQLKATRPLERRRVVVRVEAMEEGELELEVSYLVKGARWQPLYDLRLLEENGQVEITYLANVSQQSGEDWKDVALTLSTAKPALSSVMPELEPWLLKERRRPRPLPAAAKARGGGIAAAQRMMAPAAPPPSQLREDRLREAFVDAEAVEAEVEEQGVALSFKVPRKANIPGDGSAHKTTVTTINLPPILDYVVAPKLVEQAYRRATISNDSQHILLPGEVNIFHGPEFVGRANFEDAIAPGQEFEVHLGVDDRISVTRELVESRVDKKFLGNNRRLLYGYKIEVENLRSDAEKITVRDQVPVSQHEGIKVRAGRIEPQPKERTDLGLIEWELSLKPKEKRELHLAFTVEHPRDMEIVGLPKVTD